MTSSRTKRKSILCVVGGGQVLPERLAAAAMTWIEKNPSFEYALLDDDDVKLYVTAHFGARELEALRRAPSGAHRADLWRYLAIAREGGVYVDADAVCEKPIASWLGADSTLVAALNGPPRFDVSQWAFAAPPRHPVVLAAAAIAVANLLGERNASDPFANVGPHPQFRGLRRRLSTAVVSGLEVELRSDCPLANINQIGDEGLTGPPVLQAALELCVSVRAAELWRLSLAESGGLSRAAAERRALRELVALRPAEFGGAVRSKYADPDEYRADLASIGVVHWEELYTIKQRQRAGEKRAAASYRSRAAHA